MVRIQPFALWNPESIMQQKALIIQGFLPFRRGTDFISTRWHMR